MKIFETSSNDKVYHHKRSITFIFGGERSVMSTSVLNGGYREDLSYVFNKDEKVGEGMPVKMKASTHEGHLRIISEELGLMPEKSTGLSTAASMENLSVVSEYYHHVEVTAFVTGGVEVNGGRVGDKAKYDELIYKGKVKAGTINIILYVNAKLSPGIMARAIVTCTEAKTAALQELMADSRYSNGLATGSGTDGTIIIANQTLETELTNAGKHSVFGEVIGRVVKAAVKEALNKQTGLSPKMQKNIFRRGRRFGITEENLWEHYKGDLNQFSFYDRLHEIERNEMLVALSSAYLHLMDELNYSLLNEEEVYESGKMILENIASYYKFDLSLNSYEGLQGMKEMYVEMLLSMLKEVPSEKNSLCIS